MPTSTSPPSRALETLLKIIAIGAGGLLLLLVIAVTTGVFNRFLPPPPIDPEVFGLAVGRPAPPIEAAAWINGQPEHTGDKPTVVQAWFYNCPYCWQEAPELAALSQEFDDRVSFVALSPDPVSSEKLVQEFVETNNIEYPVGYGARDTLIGFEIQAFPSVWLIGADGKILWNRALEREQSLEEAIEAALARPT